MKLCNIWYVQLACYCIWVHTHTHRGKWKIEAFFDFGTRVGCWCLAVTSNFARLEAEGRSSACVGVHHHWVERRSSLRPMPFPTASTRLLSKPSWMLRLCCFLLWSLHKFEDIWSCLRVPSRLFLHFPWWMAGMYADIKESCSTWGSVHWRKKWRWSPWQVQMHFPSSSKSLARMNPCWNTRKHFTPQLLHAFAPHSEVS